MNMGYDYARLLLSGRNGLVASIFLIIMIIAYWKIFSKAGRPGWLSLIPIVNLWVICDIALGSGLYMILLFIPIVNIFVLIKLYINLAKQFGYPGLFALGLILFQPLFILILAFSDSQWNGHIV